MFQSGFISVVKLVIQNTGNILSLQVNDVYKPDILATLRPNIETNTVFRIDLDHHVTTTIIFDTSTDSANGAIFSMYTTLFVMLTLLVKFILICFHFQVDDLLVYVVFISRFPLTPFPVT